MHTSGVETLYTAAARAPLYGIVDTASAPGALRRLPTGGRPTWCLFDDVGVEDAQAVAPWLLPMAAGDERLIDATWRLAISAPCLTWIVSALPSEQLAARLCRRTEARLHGGDEVILRYYDPRILGELDAHLDGQHRQDFFNLGEAWLYLDRDARWQGIELSSPHEEDPWARSVELNPGTEAMLVQASEAGQALAAAQGQAIDLMASLRPAAAFELARRCGRELAAAGVDSHAARVMLLLLATPSAGRLLDTPQWALVQTRLKARAMELDAMAIELADVAQVVAP